MQRKMGAIAQRCALGLPVVALSSLSCHPKNADFLLLKPIFNSKFTLYLPNYTLLQIQDSRVKPVLRFLCQIHSNPAIRHFKGLTGLVGLTGLAGYVTAILILVSNETA